MIDFSDRKTRIKLFGDEDALKEDSQRLQQYYFKGIPYQQVISDDKLCLLVGYKGTGKSALLTVAHHEHINAGKPSISINAYDLKSNSSLTSGEFDLTSYVRNWKKRLTEEIIDRTFRCLDIRGGTLRDFNQSFKDEEYTDQDISYYLNLKFKNMADNALSDSAKKLLRSFLKDKQISIYIDELDTLWNGKK